MKKPLVFLVLIFPLILSANNVLVQIKLLLSESVFVALSEAIIKHSIKIQNMLQEIKSDLYKNIVLECNSISLEELRLFEDYLYLKRNIQIQLKPEVNGEELISIYKV